MEADGASLAQIERAGFPAASLPAGATADDDRKFVRELSPDAVLVDLLELDEDRADALASTGATLAVMADTGVIPKSADIAICGQFLPDRPKPASPRQRLYYGPDYLVLDDRYAGLRVKGHAETADKGANILVCFGGYCNPAAIELAIDALAETAHLWSRATVVTGAACPDELHLRAEQRLEGASIVATTDDMPRLLAESDLALVAGGFIKYEAASLGVPMLIISIVDHQVALSGAFAASGCAEHLGPVASIDGQLVADRITTVLSDLGLRSEMAERGQRLVDGRGIDRICDILFGEA